MAAAKEILGLPKMSDRSDTTPVSSEKRRHLRDLQKKPDGVSREVYSLIGGLPPMMSCLQEINFKKHLQVPSDPDTKMGWRWMPFSNPARTDDLQLHHWDKVELEKQTPEFKQPDDSMTEVSDSGFSERPKYKIAACPPKDYPYAKYNQKAEIIHYTDEEYAKYLEDENWTREETDHLLDLCEQFDLRFIVIADRFSNSRTVEELKDRYYTAAKMVQESRASTQEEVADHSLVKNSYNVQYEVERKKSLGILLSQTRRQERHDQQVLDEARRIRESRFKEKIAERARKAERKELVKMAETAEMAKTVEGAGRVEMSKLPETALPEFPSGKDVQEDEAGSPTLPTRPRRSAIRNQAAHVQIVDPARLGHEAPAASRLSPVAIVQDTLVVTTTSDNETVHESQASDLFLRSARHAKMVQEFVSQAGQRTTRRINQMFERFKCRSKVKNFTKRVCELHLELRKDFLALIKLEEELQWREAEIKTHKATNKSADKASPSTPRRSQRVNAAVSGTDSHTSSGERVSKREKRKSVRTIEH